MKVIQKLLRVLAIRAVDAYKPQIVAITGSVGKTSARHAIKTALGDSLKVRVAEENYNNEFGVPLTILGEKPQGRSITGWIGVLWRSFKVALGLDKSYPDWLVLEYGSDKKGDIRYLVEIARPNISVVTAVGISHAEFFGTLDAIKEEKGVLVRALPEDGVAVLNADDERVLGMRHMASGDVAMFGFSSNANVTARNIKINTMYDGEMTAGEVVAELTFDLIIDNDSVEVRVNNVLGDAHVRSILVGATVANRMGVKLQAIADNLRNYTPMPGRMRLIHGIKRSLLFDDSYNASPEAVHAALDVIGSFPITGTAKRIVVLGDVLELGRYSEQSHVDIGKHVASLPIDLLVTVGEFSRDLARGALSAGMDQGKVFTYATSPDAGRFVQKRMKKGDVVLIKGSQGVRMEKITKELMAEPLRAQELLVRQSNRWLSK